MKRRDLADESVVACAGVADFSACSQSQLRPARAAAKPVNLARTNMTGYQITKVYSTAGRPVGHELNIIMSRGPIALFELAGEKARGTPKQLEESNGVSGSGGTDLPSVRQVVGVG